MGTALPRRILKETERLIADPPPGISGAPANDNLRYFAVNINGPESSPYEGPNPPISILFRCGLLICVKAACSNLNFSCRRNIPWLRRKSDFSPKSIILISISSDASAWTRLKVMFRGPRKRVGLSIGNWSPALQIRTVLLSIQALLSAPNPDGTQPRGCD